MGMRAAKETRGPRERTGRKHARTRTQPTSEARWVPNTSCQPPFPGGAANHLRSVPGRLDLCDPDARAEEGSEAGVWQGGNRVDKALSGGKSKSVDSPFIPLALSSRYAFVPVPG